MIWRSSENASAAQLPNSEYRLVLAWAMGCG